jgi:hypothetical protein
MLATDASLTDANLTSDVLTRMNEAARVSFAMGAPARMPALPKDCGKASVPVIFGFCLYLLRPLVIRYFFVVTYLPERIFFFRT